MDCSSRVGAVDAQVVSQHVELTEQRVPDDLCDRKHRRRQPGQVIRRGTTLAALCVCISVCRVLSADLLFGDSDGTSGSEPHDEEDVQRRRVVADEDPPRLEVLGAFHFDWVPQNPQLQKCSMSKHVLEIFFFLKKNMCYKIFVPNL